MLTGNSSDPQEDDALPLATSTPGKIARNIRHIGLAARKDEQTQACTNNGQTPTPLRKPKVVDYDSDIDPDDLLPVYLETKTKLFHLQQTLRSRSGAAEVRLTGNESRAKNEQTYKNSEESKLQQKLQKIETDVLFDKYIANQQWEAKRVHLERAAAIQRNAAATAPSERVLHPAEIEDDSEDEVSREAAKVAAEILSEDISDDDGAIADLFANLPVTEVDPLSGKSSVVVNGGDGSKVTIRDFGKSSGVNPRRVLEEACRAR